MIREDNKRKVLDVLSLEETFQVVGGAIDSGSTAADSVGFVNIMEHIIEWWNRK